MSSDRSNVVVIVLDTARYDDVLVARSGTPLTPKLADLTAEGIYYNRAFSSSPWTLPSHASLFTGTCPSKHGAHAGHKQLTGQLRTLAEVLQNGGHETVAVSNNTWISEEFGFGRGFETFHKTWQYVQSDIDLGKIARTEEGTGKLKHSLVSYFPETPSPTSQTLSTDSSSAASTTTGPDDQRVDRGLAR
jgi:arylsulfatase A-like enzyme